VIRVDQILAAAAPGDAVTGQAIAWRELLREWGADGEILAEHVHPDLVGTVRRVDLRGGLPASVSALVLHFSIGSRVIDLALAAAAPLAVCYHNVTPGELVRPWSPGLADACDAARRALPRLRGRVTALIADSAFNAAELAQAGVGAAAVVPLILDVAPPPPRDPQGPPEIVSVGRIVPNKRIEDVVRAFALYQRHRAPDARLTLVGGDEGFTSYRQAVEAHAGELGARGVRFTGRVGDAERDAIYARAHAYLCMSAHEGFCAPLIEALGHGLPVVARAAAAIPETLGGAGILVEDPDMLPLAAEALHDVVTSAPTRAALAAAASRRLAELRPSAVAPRLRAALAPLLEAS
jgi:glycosyltransferase involved in cell wall biosynthesis